MKWQESKNNTANEANVFRVLRQLGRLESE